MAPAIVVASLFVLMNFLRIDRMDVLGRHPSGFIATDHVAARIVQSHPDQEARYAAAIAAGHISQERVNQPTEVDLFDRLIAVRRLGVGECSAIAMALNRDYGLATDDPRAINRAMRDAGLPSNQLHLMGTEDIVSTAVKLGVLTTAAAHAIRRRWASYGCFTSKLGPGYDRNVSAPLRVT